MKNKCKTLRGTSPAHVAILMCCALITGCDDGQISERDPNTSVNPQANPGHNNHGQGYGDTSIFFTDSNDNIWPPQPTDIIEVATIEQNGAGPIDPTKKVKSRTDIRQKILTNAGIANILGDNIAWLGKHQVSAKSGKVAQFEIEVFSYDTNTLVTITVDSKSGEPINYRTNEAKIYQPPESSEEVSRAIALAYDALLAQGFTEHKQLIGTALLAYPNAAEAAESGHSFYSDRKLYVTFGTGDGELPQYRATVNLSRSVVEQSGAIE